MLGSGGPSVSSSSNEPMVDLLYSCKGRSSVPSKADVSVILQKKIWAFHSDLTLRRATWFLHIQDLIERIRRSY